MDDIKAGMNEPSEPGSPGASPYAAKDPALLARNLAKALEEGGRALAAFLNARKATADGTSALEGPAAELVRTIGAVGRYWSVDPMRWMTAQARLFGSYAAIWSSAVSQTAGEPATADLQRSGDKRFADEDWRQNPFFNALKQFYLATVAWAEKLVEDAEGLDEDTRHRARFYLDQINNALSPANFPFSNPEVLKETAQTNGENLVNGMRMLAEDIQAGNGSLRIRQTDTSQFRLGETLATTPGKVIFQNALIQLIQYDAATPKVFKRPLLFVPPWINKFYVLDLTPEKSLIRWLVAEGHTVFLISWVNPDERHAAMDFESYMRDGILAALDAVEDATRERQVNAVGYCVGGTLLSATLAWLAAEGEDRVASATLLAAQVDFEHAGDLKLFSGSDEIAAVEAEMSKSGYLGGSYMADTFNLMRSNDLIWPYVVSNYLKGKEPAPFDMLYWNSDATRMPAANHAFYLRNCYLENNLSQGRMQIGGRTLNLRDVTVPIYSLATKDDHIAPAKSVFAGAPAFGGPVRFVLAGSGHIAGVVNAPARNKYQYWVGGEPHGTLADWMAEATEKPGSWWVDWLGWLEGLDSRKVARRKPGGAKLKAIEDAPGSYVKVPA